MTPTCPHGVLMTVKCPECRKARREPPGLDRVELIIRAGKLAEELVNAIDTLTNWLHRVHHEDDYWSDVEAQAHDRFRLARHGMAEFGAPDRDAPPPPAQATLFE